YPGRLQLAHIDLYRVESNSELRDLGLEELAEQGAVVVEWGDRIEVDGAALIQIEHLGGDRRLIRTIRDLSHLYLVAEHLGRRHDRSEPGVRDDFAGPRPGSGLPEGPHPDGANHQ